MGRITTFYSFKGGVGRSMALANVAFIAAMNGSKVLIMDWDLEAPGLGYYFRGLMDLPNAKAYRAAPGVLDLAWEWIGKVRTLKDPKEANELLMPFISGEKFEESVSSLIDSDLLPFEARLDILRAGSDMVSCPQPRSYEEALSELSWNQFFRVDAGGLMLNSLRRWAKEHYDYILVDSRTGLADVAGVCTMQLPDDVALCFVLNRQNMEGVARVAHAIRAKRKEEINLHILPMRIASQGTSEEADARARAKRLLTKIGSFSPDEFDEDYKSLAIQATPNVPFYETLAPIVASNPLTDPLSFNYLQLASKLLNQQFSMPTLDEWWVDRVRRRAQSRIATADYLEKLRSSVPERALEEVAQLIDAALATLLENEDELDDEYLEALIQASFEVAEQGDQDPDETLVMLQQSADILRILVSGKSDKWQPPILIEALNRILDMPGFIEPEEELSFLEEVDGLLSEDPTNAAQLRRIRHRRRAARLLISEENFDAAQQSITEIGELADRLEGVELASDQLVQVQLARLEVPILRGDIFCDQGQQSKAQRQYEKALSEVRQLDPKEGQSEFSRLRFDAHYRLALRINEMDARLRAFHAMEAARWGIDLNLSHILVGPLTEVIVAADDPELTLRYVENMFLGERSANLVAYSGRLARTGSAFFSSVVDLIQSLDKLTDQAAALPAIEELARMAAMVANSLARRRATMTPVQNQRLRRSIEQLVKILQSRAALDGVVHELMTFLHSVIDRQRIGLQRKRPPE